MKERKGKIFSGKNIFQPIHNSTTFTEEKIENMNGWIMDGLYILYGYYIVYSVKYYGPK